MKSTTGGARIVKTLGVASLVALTAGFGTAPGTATPQGVSETDGKIVGIVRFAPGSVEPPETSHELLADLARRLAESPSLQARVIGHSDNLGLEEVNVRLSVERAGSVKRYLERAGVEPTRIHLEGRGASRPVASNETPEGQSKNRRVVIELFDPLETTGKKKGFRRTRVLRFDFGGAELTSDHQAELAEVARELAQSPSLTARVVGHSDSIGFEEMNLSISIDRAEAVRERLMSEGIDGRRIRIEGKGSRRPVASNETEEGRRKNRRVVIVLETDLDRRSRNATRVESVETQTPAGVSATELQPKREESPKKASATGTGEIGTDPPSTPVEVDAGFAKSRTETLSSPVSVPEIYRPEQDGVEVPTLVELPEAVLPPSVVPPLRPKIVTVSALVDEKGRVLAVRVAFSDVRKKALKRAALEAVKAASFRPATKDGLAGRMWVRVPVTIAGGG